MKSRKALKWSGWITAFILTCFMLRSRRSGRGRKRRGAPGTIA